MEASKIEEYRQRLRDPNTDDETRDLIIEILSISSRLAQMDGEDQDRQDIREQLSGIDSNLARMQQDLAKFKN